MPRRVLHLVGSPVSATWDELSRLYGAGALAALGANGDEHRILWIDPAGPWRFPASLEPAALGAAAPLGPGAAIARLDTLGIDVMVPHMFCLPGMTRFRALFDALGIPYLGNTPEAMWLGARKDLARACVAAAGVTVPAGERLVPGQRPALATPLVIKPVQADNSDGIALVEDPAELDDALAVAFEHSSPADPAVLAETYVPAGREVRCGLLDDGHELLALPLEEYPVHDGVRPIRTRADKLGRDGDGGLALMAKTADRAWIVDPGDPACEAVWAAARRAHRALGCRHYSLFDFRIDPAGRPFFLEAGLYCSFSAQSVVATMAAAAGIPVTELFDRTVRTALGAGPPDPTPTAPTAPTHLSPSPRSDP